MQETIDYEALFKQVRTENEGLRLLIVKMRSATPSFIDDLSSRLSDFLDDEINQKILLFAGVMIVLSLIVSTVCNIPFRRFKHEE